MKKQKGMTLMEIVISIAIYGILALLVTEIMTTVNATMRATDQLNDRLAYESKFADNNMTKDSKGHSFYPDQVKYQIEYFDATGSHFVGEKESDVEKTAFEYTMNYNDPKIKGKDYVSHINYRFMTFDKKSLDPSSYPGHDFQLIVRFVPYFTSDASSMTTAEKKTAINTAKTNLTDMGSLKMELLDNAKFFDATTDGPGTDTELDYSGSYALGQEWFIDLFNPCETIAEGTNDVSAELQFNTTKEFFSAQRKWSTSKATIYYYVKVTEDILSASYYDRCYLEFNAATGEFKPLKSMTFTEFTENGEPEWPDDGKYEDILKN